MSVRSVRGARLGLMGWALALAALGCDLVGPEGEGDLDDARRLWRDQAIADYRLDVRRLCFCAFDVTRAVRVEVRGGQIVSRTYADDGAPVTVDPTLFPDVEGLFEVVEDALERGAHSLTVDYDPDLGFPRSIQIDYIEHAVDEELSFEVDRFEVTPGA